MGSQNLLKLAPVHSTVPGNEIKAAGKKVPEIKGTKHIFGLKLGRHVPLLPPGPTRGKVRSIVTLV